MDEFGPSHHKVMVRLWSANKPRHGFAAQGGMAHLLARICPFYKKTRQKIRSGQLILLPTKAAARMTIMPITACVVTAAPRVRAASRTARGGVR